MDAQSSAESILGSLDSLLVLLGDSVQDRLFRIEKSQPGSIRRSLLRTQGRLTSKLEHRDNAHLKVMMVGPVADSLARRIGEIADPESGVLSVVDFRLNRVSESLRASALAARWRVASQLNRAQTLIATRTSLQSTHAGLMGRLSGDVLIDQQVRREITDVENQLAGLQRDEVRLHEELRTEADALRQKIDAVVQMLGGYIRLGLHSRTAVVIHQPKTIEQITQMSIADRAVWWSRLTHAEQRMYDAKFHHILRNLNGLPVDYRIGANQKYLEEAARTSPSIRDALKKEGLLSEDGRLSSRVVFFDTSTTESFGESITAHGNCPTYHNVNLHYEGTGAGPGTNGSKLRTHYDEMDFSLIGIQNCTTTFVMRNTKNARWYEIDLRKSPAIDLRKSPATGYGVNYNADGGEAFVEGLRVNGSAEVLHVTGHSHGTRSAAELACRVKADAAHLQDPAPWTFSHLHGECVKRIIIYRDTDSSDAGAKILNGGWGFVEGLLETPAGAFIGDNEASRGIDSLWENLPVGFIFDDNKASRFLALFSIPEQKVWQLSNPGVTVETIHSGTPGVIGGPRDSIYETNQGSSHGAFVHNTWRTEQKIQIAKVNAIA